MHFSTFQCQEAALVDIIFLVESFYNFYNWVSFPINFTGYPLYWDNQCSTLAGPVYFALITDTTILFKHIPARDMC